MQAITKITASISDNFHSLSEILGNPGDLNMELHGPDNSVGLAFITSLTNQNDIKSNLLGPLINLLQNQFCQSLDQIIAMLPETIPRRHTNLESVASDMLEGRTAVFLKDKTEAVSFSTQGWTKHEPKEPAIERVIRGPREGFTETLEENMGMIRRWIKDRRLRADMINIGRRTKTGVAVMYISDIAQPRLVREVHSRLSAIDIDGVIESSYIEQLIKDRRASVFPLTQSTERTDKATAAILEGRVAILVDKSPTAVIVPVTVNELYQSAEDYYFDFWLGSLLRFVRLFSNILAVALPGLYVALVSVNPELLPVQFALTISGSRIRIPIPLIAEVFLLEFVVEVFREAGIRLPGMVGQTLGVVSGVILGLVSVQAGIVAPATLVVVAITGIASFTGPNYAVGVTWRLLKYLLLIAGGVFGLYGLIIVGLGILIHAGDLKSFGVSYLAPWSPLQWRELADAPVRAPFWFRWLRPKTYRPQDRLRTGGTKKEDETHE